MNRLTRILTVVSLVLALCCLPALMAQSGRGTITGIVRDSSGAIIPAAEVVVTNVDTGVALNTLTTESGVYRIPYIPPGKYRASVTIAGFKTAVRENIEIHVTDTVTVDFTLEVGQISDSVTVSSTAPLLERASAEIGTVTTEKEMANWPIQIGDGTRGIQTFIFTSMPGTEGGEWQGSINGSQQFSHEILIDGISLGRFDLNGGSTSEFTVTMDAVSQSKLQTGALGAQYGNTQTSLANFGMKSGTNEYHGSAFWFHQNSALNANAWGANNNGRLDPETGKAYKAKTKLNNYGATFGGPIRKDKTFFFFSYEENRQANYNPSTTYNNSPTAQMKKGDFSQLLNPAFTQNASSGKVVGTDALGRPVIFGQIYDPLTIRQAPNGDYVRDPFLGNIIPTNRFSAVTNKILNPAYALPDPTFPLVGQIGETLRRNTIRISGCCPELYIKNISIKVDEVLTAKHKLSGSFTENDRYRLRYGGGSNYALPGSIPNTPATGDKKQSTPGFLVRMAEDWTISPTMLNHFGFGYNRFVNENVSNTLFSGKNWAQELGMTNVGGATFPVMTFNGATQWQSGQYLRWGYSYTGISPNGSGIVQNDFTWIKGKHSLRTGVEHRRYYNNVTQQNTPGTYNFDGNQTGLSNFSSQTGFAFASFLLGAVRNASDGIVGITQGTRARTTAFYVQDDWKVSQKLTLNLGVRWDIPTGYTNPNNFMSGLDPNVPNPGADGYPGALVFLGDCAQCNKKTRWTDIYYGEWAPRIGVAYAVSNKLILRGGYGINYAPPLADGFGADFFEGFDGSNFISSKTGRKGNGNDPAYFWDNPYPKYTAKLPNFDPAQLNDGSIGYYPNDLNKYPKVHNWNFGVQFELPWQTRMEANYVGSKGTRLSDSYHFNTQQLNPSYLSLGDTLLEDISDHPEIKKPYPSFSGTVGQALLPFPQYRGISTPRSNSGWSNYNSLQITATKRMSTGLSFLVAYTFSKNLASADDALGYYGGYGQTIYNRKLDYTVTSLNVPQDLRVTWIYDLPFGAKGHWLKSGALSYILGGWTISGINNWRSGAPLSISNGSGPDTGALSNSGFYVDTLLGRDKQIIGSKPSDPDRGLGTPYLNPAAWGPVPVTDNNVPTRLPNGVRFQPNLRGFAQSGEQLSIIKRTTLPFRRETSSFEFRADIVNPLNRTSISDPNTDISDPTTFGRVFDKGNPGGPRTIQLGIRITF
jgi:hypothetical protein